MLRKYTEADIGSAWNRYQSTQVLKVLRNGRWETARIGISPKNATRVVLTTTDKAMSFPKFLKEYYNERRSNGHN